MGPSPAVAATRLAVRRALATARLRPGCRVLVACSGGADSLALAAAVGFEAPGRQLEAVAVTVDHGLQPGSAARAAAVVAAAPALGLAAAEAIAVRIGAEGGPEAAARTARYAALDAALRRLRADAVLLGHTLDDQAETVLLGLARGAGARSLAGMAAARGPYLRPFLDLPRATVRQACADLGLEPWEDPHNADPGYARARVRSHALPALEAALGPGMAAALARTARLLRADADALDELAATALPAARDAEGRLDVTALGVLPAAVRARVLRRAAIDAGAPAGALAAGHVEALDALVTAWHGQGPVALPGRLAGERLPGGRLALRPQVPAGRAEETGWTTPASNPPRSSPSS